MKLITKKKKKSELNVWELAIAIPTEIDHATLLKTYSTCTTTTLKKHSLEKHNVLKPVRDGLDKTYFIHLLVITFFAPFSFQTAQCCKCPDTDKKKRQEQGF